MAHPRYAPSGAVNFSLTRIITSAAVLAAAALVCAPALESAGRTAAAASVSESGLSGVEAGAAGAESSAGTAGAGLGSGPPGSGQPGSGQPGSGSPAPSSSSWPGAIPIRPSTFATVPPAPSGTGVSPGPSGTGVSVVSAVFGPAGEVGALGIPAMVLRAYHQAAAKLAVEEPSCKLPWWLLAGIGHTESGHAEDGRLSADGTTRGKILGPRLNGGIAGDAIISDTDHGAYDGDTGYDRAVGPMQFIPSTWLRWGADGNADGKRDPSNIFDATLAAGHYLCADGRDLSTTAGLQAAVLSYNHSAPYLKTVLAWGTAYRSGASSVDDSLLPVVADVTKVRPPVSSRPPKRKPAVTRSSKTPSGSHGRSSPSGASAGSGSGGSAAGGRGGTRSGSSSGAPSASPTPTGSGSGPGSSSAQPTPTGSTSGSPTAKPCGSPTSTTSARATDATSSAAPSPRLASSATVSASAAPASAASTSAVKTSAASPTATPTTCAP
ncbi:lytic transglycosylase domain-containing protein [Jatrophihabitans lederbergiae]|uniref:Lytic murein transglycosylase n=1 Tax=Jatrophihabitans lederbergiae TaxID=3075547 RepID=A0ABU2J5K4_9ACTN|nr:lytic murein transglycosylase [Jatrophihabitans sp. DSM 44399]MDT0260272.1 lytic murein transglycosylase [Jatrophihabitans sp. DSM 44399]